MPLTYQETARRLQALEARLQEHISLYGYEPIFVPVIEPATTFLTRASDRIINKLFTFEHYGQQLALRPEFTAAVARHYVQSGQTGAVRWQFSGPIFADDPDDHSLSFQTGSVGAEFIGEADLYAEAEIIAMTAHAIAKQNIPDWQLVLGHVGLQLHLLQRFGLDSRTNRALLAQRQVLKDSQAGKATAIANLEQLLGEPHPDHAPQQNHVQDSTQGMLDVLLDSTPYGATMGGRSRRDIARRLLTKREREQEREQVLAALEFLNAWVNLAAEPTSALAQIDAWVGDDAQGQALLNEWRALLSLLEAADVPSDHIVIQADLTRNWEYYTGVVFGVCVPSGAYVAGGGRYDALLQLLGSDRPVPAIGVAFYVDAMLENMPSSSPNSTSYSFASGAMAPETVMTWLQGLREEAIAVQQTKDDANAILRGTPNGIMYGGHVYSLDKLTELVEELREAHQ